MGVVILLAVFIAGAVLTYRNTQVLIADEAWVSHTQEALGDLDSLESLITAAESGQRGYLITGDDRYLDPYHNAMGRIPAELQHLRKLTADNPRQQQRLKDLDAAITDKLNELRITVGLRRTQGPAAAQREVETHLGKAKMENIRSIMAAMEGEENALLLDRVRRSQESGRRALTVTVLSSILGVALVLLITALFIRFTNEREHGHQQIVELAEHLKLAMRGANAWSWEYSVPSGRVRRSEDVSRFFGLPPGTVSHTLDATLMRYHPEDAERFRRLLAMTIESGAELDDEFRTVWPDGTVHWLAVRAHCIRDAHQRPLHVVGISFDITERKKAEEMLRETERLASAGRLAATLAHEINNPLESVTSIHYLLLKHGSLEPDARKQLEIAQEEMSRAVDVIRSTLGLYRDTTVPLAVDVVSVLDNVLALHERTLRSRHIAINKLYETDARVHGYRGEIRQIFINLVGNALDAMPPRGTLTLHAYDSVDWNQGVAGVKVIIGDTGPGISAENRNRLFRPFFTTKGEKGTGLGLWVSRQLAEKHGGTIRVWSRARGKTGAWFAVFLPTMRTSGRQMAV